MTTSTWHAAPDALARFALDPAGLDDSSAASIETHLVTCDRCRAEVARLADPARTATSWDAVADRIDRPRVSLIQHVLQFLGISSGSARLAAATPGLRLSGVGAVAALTALAVAAARNAEASGPFLVLAPLIPLAAVALTFAATADPAGETGLATPLHGGGLVMRRAAAVLVLAFAVLAIGAVAAPSLGPAPLAWILPGTAISLGSLALATWVRVESAACGLAVAWITALGVARYLDGFDAPVASTALFAPAGQAVALTLTLLALAVVMARADRFSTLEARQ